MAGIAGKRGRITVDGTRIQATEANVSDEGEDIPTDTFEDLGFSTGDTGIEVLNWDFKALWQVTGIAPGIYPRPDLTALVITPTTLGAIAATMPLARVLSGKCMIPVKGSPVTFDAAGKSQGSFTRVAP